MNGIGKILLGAGGMCAGLLLAGCVERTLTIASDPPGALVSLNDKPVGRTGKDTPLKVPFTWYGDYDVRLTLERWEGPPDKQVLKRYYLHTHKVAEAPPSQWLGVDLISDVVPWEVRDDKLWVFVLKPVVDPSDEDLIARANALKSRLGEPQELRPLEKVKAADKAAAERAAAEAAATQAAATRAATRPATTMPTTRPAVGPTTAPAKRP